MFGFFFCYVVLNKNVTGADHKKVCKLLFSLTFTNNKWLSPNFLDGMSDFASDVFSVMVYIWVWCCDNEIPPRLAARFLKSINQRGRETVKY